MRFLPVILIVTFVLGAVFFATNGIPDGWNLHLAEPLSPEPASEEVEEAKAAIRPETDGTFVLGRVPVSLTNQADGAHSQRDEEADKDFEDWLAVATELLQTRAEVGRLGLRVQWLETELDLCGSEVTQGSLGLWLKGLHENERPERETLLSFSRYMRLYPVELAHAEGVWLVERIEANDWKEWGATLDEAIILFLGPERLRAELPAKSLATLREYWIEEGYFSE